MTTCFFEDHLEIFSTGPSCGKTCKQLNWVVEMLFPGIPGRWKIRKYRTKTNTDFSVFFNLFITPYRATCDRVLPR
jgi:hypothetical protein